MDNTHLHQFAILEKHYGVPDEEDVGLTETKDEGKYKLHDLVRGEDSGSHRTTTLATIGARTTYRKGSSRGKRRSLPALLDGARAVRGRRGRDTGLQAFSRSHSHPTHPKHKEFLDWISSEFDPEEFDVDEVNHILRSLK